MGETKAASLHPVHKGLTQKSEGWVPWVHAGHTTWHGRSGRWLTSSPTACCTQDTLEMCTRSDDVMQLPHLAVSLHRFVWRTCAQPSELDLPLALSLFVSPPWSVCGTCWLVVRSIVFPCFSQLLLSSCAMLSSLFAVHHRTLTDLCGVSLGCVATPSVPRVCWLDAVQDW